MKMDYNLRLWLHDIDYYHIMAPFSKYIFKIVMKTCILSKAKKIQLIYKNYYFILK